MGGSFDPPTISHMQIAAEIYNMNKFDEVWVIPCGERPDKPHISASKHRLAMTKQAVKEFMPKNFPIKVSDIEVRNGKSIPTYYLMKQLEQENQGTAFHFIAGSDLIPSLHLWDEGQKLIDEINFIIIER